MFERLTNFIKGVWRKVLPYKDIETVERVETPLSTDMANALDKWYNMYLNKADWLKPDTVKSLAAQWNSGIFHKRVNTISGKRV